MKGLVVSIVKGRAHREEWERLTVVMVVVVEQQTLIDWELEESAVESQKKVKARFG